MTATGGCALRIRRILGSLGAAAALCCGAAAQDALVGPSMALKWPGEPISAFIREVFQSRDGVYWFGTNGDGLARYDGDELTYLSLKDGLGGSAIRGILQADDGAMWFATDGGVSRYADGAFTNYTTDDGLSAGDAWSIMRDRAGTIWVGTHRGVCRFDGERFEAFPLPRVEVDAPESRFTPEVVFAMIEDHDGNLWFGTDGEGVHRYDGKAFTSFTTRDGLAGDMVRSLCEDRHGRVWIGTEGGGVSRYDGESFMNFTQADGLNNDRVFEIYEDRAGNMWFSTLGAGACRYNGVSFAPFGVEQGLSVNDLPCACGSGLLSRDCHGPGGGHVQEFFQDRGGVMWFGCSGGLFYLDGERLVHVSKEGPWPRAHVDDALATFAHLVGGEWRVTFESKAAQFDRWAWGPGGHSLRSRTFNSKGDGESTTGVRRVLYRHPGRGRAEMLTLHWFDLMGTGPVTIEGEKARYRYDLFYGEEHPYSPMLTRPLVADFVFDGPDKYSIALSDDAGGEPGPPMAVWKYARSAELTPIPATAADPPRPVKFLGAFETLAGRTWATGDDAGSARVEWIPYAEAVFASIKFGGRTIETHIYHHPITDVLLCLALTDSGGVYEGTVRVDDDGAIVFDLTGYEGDAVIKQVVGIVIAAAGRRVTALVGAGGVVWEGMLSPS